MPNIIHITRADDLSISNNQLVMIDEDNNNEKNDDIKILKIEDLIESKKVSVLELESYNSDYIKNLIIELLTKIENTNDTL